MSKALINLASWLFALVSAAAVLWRFSSCAGFPALAFGGQKASSPTRFSAAARVRMPTLFAGSGLCARAAHASAQGPRPRAEHLRSRAPRTCSTTAFGLFDATRERGMGHPAG
jgi:hypothetical protein